jgi:hypothetical protein
MKLEYFFNGIEISDGKYPAAKVLVRATPESTPEELMCPRIEISLPISDRQCESAVFEIARSALQSARQLLNEKVLADWVADQAQKG